MNDQLHMYVKDIFEEQLCFPKEIYLSARTYQTQRRLENFSR